MLVNLTDVFVNEGKVQNISVEYEPNEFVSQLGQFVIKQKNPIELKLSNIGRSKALVEGKANLTFAFTCDRCLRDVDYTFDLSFSFRAISPDCMEQDEESAEMDYIEGYHLNVDELINNEILLNWPMKVLCTETCKGICKKCGKNLNEGDCDCDDFVPDPRMAAIKDIFYANKEV